TCSAAATPGWRRALSTRPARVPWYRTGYRRGRCRTAVQGGKRPPRRRSPDEEIPTRSRHGPPAQPADPDDRERLVHVDERVDRIGVLEPRDTRQALPRVVDSPEERDGDNQGGGGELDPAPGR